MRGKTLGNMLIDGVVERAVDAGRSNSAQKERQRAYTLLTRSDLPVTIMHRLESGRGRCPRPRPRGGADPSATLLRERVADTAHVTGGEHPVMPIPHRAARPIAGRAR